LQKNSYGDSLTVSAANTWLECKYTSYEDGLGLT